MVYLKEIEEKPEVSKEQSTQTTFLLIYGDLLQRFVAVILGSSTGKISLSVFFHPSIW